MSRPSDIVPASELRAFFASFANEEPTPEEAEREATRRRILKEITERESADRKGAALFDLDPVLVGKSPIETLLIERIGAWHDCGPGNAPCRDGEPLFGIDGWWAFSQLEINGYFADIGFVREIHRNAKGCAEEVISMLRSRRRG